VQIKKGHSWSEQIGIAIALLLENGKAELVNWTKDVSRVWRRIREGTNGCPYHRF